MWRTKEQEHNKGGFGGPVVGHWTGNLKYMWLSPGPCQRFSQRFLTLGKLLVGFSPPMSKWVPGRMYKSSVLALST